MAPSLEIRVLGELEVVRGGETLALPASKKTRALLGYLVVVGGRAQPRPRLCELLWDGPDDPRAALRWSLTKLRPLLDDAGGTRLSADREHVGFERKNASVDLAWIGENVGDAARAPIERLRRAASLFRGELLEGLDLPECYRFHEWCVAEREQARRRHGDILAALADRLDEPEEALTHARRRVAIDPLAEAGHIAVMQLLAKLGRPREAIKQYESCRRILEGQLGRGPSKELEAARSMLGRVPATPPTPAVTAPPATRNTPLVAAQTPVETRAPLVGRAAEQAVLAEALREASRGANGRVLFVLGESGIGKTRLLGEAAEYAAASGGAALFGRAFEAEMVRPYGAWIDVLRSAPLGAMDDSSLRADLAPLLPELGDRQVEIDRNRLFQGVVRLLVERAVRGPLVVALDDVQWFDEASTALLHYAARNLVGSRVLLVCAARAPEIDGNPRAQALVRALLREGRLTRLELSPLDAGATAELVRSIGEVDASRIFADAGGNPLFSIELARALAQGDGGTTAHTLDGLIAERLSRLDERGAELLPWAAALGGAFSIDTLEKVTSLPTRDLFAAVADLERHGVLRVGASAPNVGYDFAHDLVRRSAYRSMSEPRRRWVHLQIARALSAAGDPGDALAGDIAHHAALGGDSALAARAYVAAGERCLRIFALADASQLAASGIPHVDHLPPEEGVPLRVELLSVQVRSHQWLRRSSELEAQLARAASAAREQGMPALVAHCHYLTAYSHHERGDFERAVASSLQAEQAGRAADIRTRQLQIANTGRCLAMIERDMAHAQDLLNEAKTLGENAIGRTMLELTFGLGVMHAFKGEDDQAIPLIERAAELAALESDHWVQSQALTRLARIALERDRPEETISRCLALRPLVAKLSEGSEQPLVATLEALARLKLDEAGAGAAVEEAIARLRGVDSKAYLAYALDVAAELDVRASQAGRAHERATEALAAATAVAHRSEAAVARALLARLALERGDRAEAAAQLGACKPDLEAPLALSARARAAVSFASSLL